VTGLKERGARDLLGALVADGILASDTPKGPVSLRFPLDAVDMLFPALFSRENALPGQHRVVGTATLASHRSLGGPIGVTGAGAILSLRLHKDAKSLAGQGSRLPVRAGNLSQALSLSPLWQFTGMRSRWFSQPVSVSSLCLSSGSCFYRNCLSVPIRRRTVVSVVCLRLAKFQRSRPRLPGPRSDLPAKLSQKKGVIRRADPANFPP
jgi:hypothetical protein